MTMLSSLRTWSIHYCKRTANSVADLLAKYVIPAVQAGQASLPAHIREAINEDIKCASNHTRSFFVHPGDNGTSSCAGYSSASSIASSAQDGNGDLIPADDVSSTRSQHLDTWASRIGFGTFSFFFLSTSFMLFMLYFIYLQ